MLQKGHYHTSRGRPDNAHNRRLAQNSAKPRVLDETAGGGADPDGHRGGAAAPGDVPGDLSAWSWTRKSLARPRPEHEPGDDRDRPSRRQTRQPLRRAASLRPTASGEGYSY